jgi:hypothetical protein
MESDPELDPDPLVRGRILRYGSAPKCHRSPALYKRQHKIGILMKEQWFCVPGVWKPILEISVKSVMT